MRLVKVGVNKAVYKPTSEFKDKYYKLFRGLDTEELEAAGLTVSEGRREGRDARFARPSTDP